LMRMRLLLPTLLSNAIRGNVDERMVLRGVLTE